MSSYGDAGKVYMNWCANFANSLDIGVPWIMCQQSDAPSSVVIFFFFFFSHFLLLIYIYIVIIIKFGIDLFLEFLNFDR